LSGHKPARIHRYRPDFTLPNGIIIEGKGIFEAADREKHLLLKEQRPDLDIRFVFSRSEAPIYPKSPTTLADVVQASSGSSSLRSSSRSHGSRRNHVAYYPSPCR
jgi:hypothetical protein